ncbi:unnamed protein product [Ixodes persulcatus]
MSTQHRHLLAASCLYLVNGVGNVWKWKEEGREGGGPFCSDATVHSKTGHGAQTLV